MRILKQVIGVDVSKDELIVTFGQIKEDLRAEIGSAKAFVNSGKGFEKLLSWTNSVASAEAKVQFVMEATGVYHERLGAFLYDQSIPVSIVLPNKISNYFKTLDVKTVTDSTSAEAITRFGLERKLDSWAKPASIFKALRQLTRERDQIVSMRTMAKNHLHAEMAESEPNTSSIQRTRIQIDLLNEQDKQIREEIKKLARDEKVKRSIEVMSSIPGIGILTAVTVLAETNGFELVRNKKQLSSYAGLDVREKLSGVSVKGRPKISKRGNRYLRKSLHMPVLATIRIDDNTTAFYDRLVSRHGIKMKAVVAAQRKVLELMYTLFKKNEMYDPAFASRQLQKRERQPL